MSFIVDILSGGGLGALFGGIQRVIEKGQDNAFRLKEFGHIEEMHRMQFQQDMRLARQELMVEELKQAGEALTASYDHDASFKPHTWVDDIRAMVRPTLTFALVYMAYKDPEEFLTLASAVVLWWFASRVSIPRIE